MAKTISTLLELFDSLANEGDLQRLITEKAQEDLHLEFKTKHDRRTPELEEGDAFHFSRALSGFANSDGGLLIWGVETKRLGVVDKAYRLKPIAAAEEFASRLSKSLLASTQPVVDAVVIRHVSSDAAVTGYVKCLIPASEKTPHRAMLANREYFKRTSEGFYRLEHFDLEDMFGRRPRPKLQLQAFCRLSRRRREELRFSVRNVGRGTARYYGFLCRFEGDVKVYKHSDVQDITELNGGKPTIQYPSNNKGAVHPDCDVYLGMVEIERPDATRPISAKVTLYAENMRTETISFVWIAEHHENGAK